MSQLTERCPTLKDDQALGKQLVRYHGRCKVAVSRAKMMGRREVFGSQGGDGGWSRGFRGSERKVNQAGELLTGGRAGARGSSVKRMSRSEIEVRSCSKSV